MKKSLDLVIVIPIGPSCKEAFIIDTIASLDYYVKCSYKIILADDSQTGMGWRIQAIKEDVDVVITGKPNGKLCGLYITLSMAFQHALAKYHFKALLRMDTDALIIGEQPEKETIALFETHPQVGIAGQYPLDYQGNKWDISWARTRILNGVTTWRFIRRPIANWLLRPLYRKAVANGYTAGESVFGGAYFISEKCLESLSKAGLLPNKKLRVLNLEEDHLFAVLIKALGMQLGDLSSGGKPMGCAWKGLPASPQHLLADGKKIIHSTRYWEDMKEEDIRQFFRVRRTE